MNKFAVLGGGIGGLTLAIALQRKNIDVTVYEAAPQWKPVGAGLGLAGNAVKAFREIGIEKEILREGKVLKQVVIRNPRGKILASTDSEEVSRRFGCMAIEDAAVLSNLLEGSQTVETVEAAFKLFEEKRIRRTTKIVNDSWQIGKLAQLQNPFMASIRNLAISLVPKKVTDNQFKFIYDVSLR